MWRKQPRKAWFHFPQKEARPLFSGIEEGKRSHDCIERWLREACEEISANFIGEISGFEIYYCRERERAHLFAANKACSVPAPWRSADVPLYERMKRKRWGSVRALSLKRRVHFGGKEVKTTGPRQWRLHWPTLGFFRAGHLKTQNRADTKNVNPKYPIRWMELIFTGFYRVFWVFRYEVIVGGDCSDCESFYVQLWSRWSPKWQGKAPTALWKNESLKKKTRPFLRRFRWLLLDFD